MKSMKLILAVIFMVCCLYSCVMEQPKKNLSIRKYEVRLSNFVGSDYYECDSIIWISDYHFKLKNKESVEPFMDVIIPKDVVVRISLIRE